MANDKASPEERLFNVIQEEKNTPPVDVDAKKKKIKLSVPAKIREIRQFFGHLNLVKKFNFNWIKPKAQALENLTGSGKAFREIAPRIINKSAIALLVILTGLVIHTAINERPSLVKIVNAISRIKIQDVRKKTIEAFKPVAVYLEVVKKRDIFIPTPRAQKKIAEPPKPKKTGPGLEELARNLKLVGVSWGKAPQAMIKNVKEQNTYFVKQGQMIGATGIQVKTILKEKIIISYQDEEMDLL